MELFHGLSALTWQQVVMVGVGLLLIYLAAVKEYEPSLLLPMGFGKKKKFIKPINPYMMII